MSSVTTFAGEHAIAMLLLASSLMLVATALVWKLIEWLWEPTWRFVARLWDRVTNSTIGEWLRHVPLLGPHFSRTLSVWRYLGIHATLSLAAAFIAFGTFVALADEIHPTEELARFDVQLASALKANVSQTTLELFAKITHLGDRNVTVGIGIAVLIYLAWRRWWLHAITWALTTGIGGVLIRVLKHHFERARPIHDHALTDSTGWSFPSGHAAGAMLIYGMLGYFVIRHTPSRWHIPIALVTMTVVSFVGFSRVILHVHYLSDVLAGFAVAGAWMALCVTAFEVLRRRSETRYEHAD